MTLMDDHDKPVNPPSINELLKRVKERGIGKITKQTKNNKTKNNKTQKKQKAKKQKAKKQKAKSKKEKKQKK
jgi:hypothetical protein